MPEAAPQYISPISPEPLPQTPDLSDRVGKIDNEAVRRKYEQLKPLNQLETLIKEGEKQLPTEPYSYEIRQIRDRVLHQAEQILKLKEDVTSARPDQLAEKLKTDYGAKKIEDLLYKPPWQSTEFDQSKANCQALWEKFTSQFSEAQAAAREWFENKYKIKIFRPEQGERFDPTLEEITQYSIIDLQTPTNPKSGVYISRTPGLMLGNKVIEKTDSVSTNNEVSDQKPSQDNSLGTTQSASEMESPQCRRDKLNYDACLENLSHKDCISTWDYELSCGTAPAGETPSCRSSRLNYDSCRENLSHTTCLSTWDYETACN